jgi:predicted polyphosphate/ATP-dependent NAD kinase
VLVNPIAGIGGAVGLKGSDGTTIVRRALELGAVPHAGERAVAALDACGAAWGSTPSQLVVVAAPGPMGADSARTAGLLPVVVGSLDVGATTASDTVRLARALIAAGADLLLVAGGDGTLRDVCAAIGNDAPVVGVPAGVKIHSPAFARSPRAAGEAAAAFLAVEPARRRTQAAEVLDLDEAAYRRGEVAPALFGEVLVPSDTRRMQARKERSPRSEAEAAIDVALGVRRHLAATGPSRVLLGPGSTMRAVADALGVAKTLTGVDVVDVPAGHAAPGGLRASLIAPDAGSTALERLVRDVPARIVVTVIGGQGFILGRGNQQLGPGVIGAVLDTIGRAGIIVAATEAKLAALRGRPLLVDTGDAALDARLAGHITVITGTDERAVYRVEPA